MDWEKTMQYVVMGGVLLMQAIAMNRQANISKKLDKHHDEKVEGEKALCQFRQTNANLTLQLADIHIAEGLNSGLKEKRAAFKEATDDLNRQIISAAADHAAALR